MSTPEETAQALRSKLLDGWDVAARGWRRGAEGVRAMGMPVSAWLVEHLDLQPGERVLELAAGPGDTGFLAAELIRPGGTLICSDGSEKMLDIARERAGRQGIDNVEFKQLQLEWIDMETASVDAIICRWGIMLLVDPAAALQECRRVLKPGGRLSMAVWAAPELNPWATVPSAAVQALGVLPPPDPTVPGPFSLSRDGHLAELLQEAGFVDLTVETVEVERHTPDFDSFVDETLDLSHLFALAWTKLSDEQQAKLLEALREGVAPFTQPDGALVLPGVTFVALAHA
jgi:ubiquinone/menaquinone biosynthesis C-methylase UbiE